MDNLTPPPSRLVNPLHDRMAVWKLHKANGDGGMAGEAKPDLLERIEANAGKVPPLWQWLVWAALPFLPIYLGYDHITQIEQMWGPLQRNEINSIMRFVVAGFLGLWFICVFDMNKGYLRRWLRQPDFQELPPGPFRLGGGIFGLISLPWWAKLAGLIIVSVVSSILVRLGIRVEPMSLPSRTFLQFAEVFGWIFAVMLGALGLVTIVGLFIQQRLRERGRPL